MKNKVTAHIPVPEKIKITKEDRISGVKYYVMFSKNEHDESYISIIDSKGEKKNKGLSKEIYDDIMDYLKKNGFFSPIHWERESSTWSCEKIWFVLPLSIMEGFIFLGKYWQPIILSYVALLMAYYSIHPSEKK